MQLGCESVREAALLDSAPETRTDKSMRPSKSPGLLSIVVIALLVATAGCTGRSSSTSSQAGSDSQPHPPIQLLDLDGHSFDLWKQRPAHTTVVVFTRSDCPISNRFAPEICRLHEAYHPRGVDFYLVYVDPRETSDAIRQHMQEFNYPCSALRDPSHSLVAYCQATATPEAAVFNGEREITYLGRINDLYVELGSQRAEPTTHDLEDAIESTVQGRPVATPRTRAIGCSIVDLKN